MRIPERPSLLLYWLWTHADAVFVALLFVVVVVLSYAEVTR